jgi:cyclase
MSTTVITTPDEVLEPDVEEVSDGIFAYLQLYGQWGLNNAGYIVGDDRVLVVDTCFTVGRARRFRETIESRVDQPLRMLVNTHHHGDHTWGNFLFRDTTIVAHERCRAEMIATGLETQRLFAPGVDWGPIEIEPAFVTFEDRLDLYVGDLKVEAHFMGPAHTTNDVVYHVPERGLMFAGDLAFSGGTPFVMMGSVQGSIDAYERLQRFDVQTIVPGHGPVCGPELLGEMAEYLRMIQRVARDARGRGVGPLEAARETDLGQYAGWHDRERIVGNLHRAFSELRGEAPGAPLDYAPVVADMFAYNGGNPLHCFA